MFVNCIVGDVLFHCVVTRTNVLRHSEYENCWSITKWASLQTSSSSKEVEVSLSCCLSSRLHHEGKYNVNQYVYIYISSQCDVYSIDMRSLMQILDYSPIFRHLDSNLPRPFVANSTHNIVTLPSLRTNMLEAMSQINTNISRLPLQSCLMLSMRTSFMFSCSENIS